MVLEQLQVNLQSLSNTLIFTDITLKWTLRAMLIFLFYISPHHCCYCSFCLICLDLEAVEEECTHFLLSRYVGPTQEMKECPRIAIFLGGGLEVLLNTTLSCIGSQIFFLCTNTNIHLYTHIFIYVRVLIYTHVHTCTHMHTQLKLLSFREKYARIPTNPV